MEKESQGFGRYSGLILGLIVVLAIGAAWYWKPWQKPSSEQKLDLAIPAIDTGHGRQGKMTAKDGGTISVVDSRNVRFTLSVPADALTSDTTVQLIPFFADEHVNYPTSGVMVSPGSIAFARPATLTVDLEQSGQKSDAPSSFSLTDIRITGSSQVLLMDDKADTFTPMLVSRPSEIATVIPARIISGGAFVWSASDTHAVTYAKQALAAKVVHPLVALEAGSRLLGTGTKLSKAQTVQITRAVTGTLAADNPAGPELFAAAALQKQHKIGLITGFISRAYAADLNRGYLETRCKDRSLSLNDYLSAAQTAQLLGYEDLGEACLTAAKNVVAQESEVLLSSANPDPVQLMVQLQRVQILGLDDDSNLDDRLIERAQAQVTKEGRTVLNDPTATAIDVAKALQKIQGIGGNDPAVETGLGAKLEALGRVDVEPLDLEEEHPDLIPGFDMSVIALPLAQLMGLDSFDESGIRGFTDEWLAKEGEFKEMAGAMCALISELGGPLPPECSSYEAEFTRLFNELEREGYRAADEVGDIQDEEFEEPEYDDAQLTIDCNGLTEDERRDLGCPPEDDDTAGEPTEPEETVPDTDDGAQDLEDAHTQDDGNQAEPEEVEPDSGGGA